MSTHGTEHSASSEDTLRAQIRDEYDSYVFHTGGKVVPTTPALRLMFFNNMDLLFPVRFNNPDDIMVVGIRNLWDQKPVRDSSAEYHSRLYFSQTNGKFIQTVHQVIEELGLLERANAACLKEAAIELGSEPNPEDIEEREEVYLKIYTELRLMGYSHYDITG